MKLNFTKPSTIKSKRFLFAVAPALTMLTLAAGLCAQSTVTIYDGKLQGTEVSGVDAFKGIPYAAPPVGPLRWRAPQPPAAWTGVRSAAQYGHDCMQLPFPSDAAPLGTKPAEDCLVLNVWAPAHRDASHPLPVMVWIYGGGFVNGGSSPAVYDGSEFALGGVVFVSFNYRLGRFGFFAHPALTRENPDGPLGNYGYMDQIAALNWVKQNVAAFGGDPQKVTLFGESAGGGSVHAMMNAPQARGLFQKAIVESGGGRVRPGGAAKLHEASGTKPSGEQAGVAFAKSKGITGEDAEALAKLRALPAETIVDGLNMASMAPAAATYAGPMIDGQIVMGEPQAAYKAGTQAHVPFIIGANNADIGMSSAKSMDELFTPFHDKVAAQTLYDPNHTGDLHATAARVAADSMMVEPARFVARAMANAGEPIWEYRFSYVADSMLKDWLAGAPHATEIPYVFDTVRARYQAALTPTDAKVAKAMHDYWLQFAKTGDPNGPGLPKWPQYSAQSDTLINFTKDGPIAEPDRWKQRLDMTEATR